MQKLHEEFEELKKATGSAGAVRADGGEDPWQRSRGTTAGPRKDTIGAEGSKGGLGGPSAAEAADRDSGKNIWERKGFRDRTAKLSNEKGEAEFRDLVFYFKKHDQG